MQSSTHIIVLIAPEGMTQDDQEVFAQAAAEAAGATILILPPGWKQAQIDEAAVIAAVEVERESCAQIVEAEIANPDGAAVALAIIRARGAK